MSPPFISPLVSLKCRMCTRFVGDDLLLAPKNFQETAHVGDGAISLQSCQEAAMIYSGIRLLKV